MRPNLRQLTTENRCSHRKFTPAMSTLPLPQPPPQPQPLDLATASRLLLFFAQVFVGVVGLWHFATFGPPSWWFRCRDDDGGNDEEDQQREDEEEFGTCASSDSDVDTDGDEVLKRE